MSSSLSSSKAGIALSSEALFQNHASSNSSTLSSSATGSLNRSSFNEEDGDVLCVSLFTLFLLLCWLVWLILISILLVGDDTVMGGSHSCGNLWEFVLIRTICFALEYAQVIINLFVREMGLTQCFLCSVFGYSASNDENAMPYNNENDTDHVESASNDATCFELALGNSLVAIWTATLFHFCYNAAFAIAALIVLPPLLMRSYDPNESAHQNASVSACLDALSSGSFTGTYTLALFAWGYLIIDGGQAIGRGVWLSHVHTKRQLLMADYTLI